MAGAVLVLGGGRAELTAFADPGYANGFNIQFDSTVYSNNINIRAQGGLAPYTYSWVRDSGTSQTRIINSTSSSVFFYAYISEGTVDSTWTCTVTDALGASVPVSISCQLSAGNVS